MANTFTQIYIHIVFSVRSRASLIKEEWRKNLHQYITGIVQNKGHKMLAINSMPDHIHIFIGMKPDTALSDLVRDIKANSSKWINEEKIKPKKFEWQAGYGAFSYSHSQIGEVILYIKRQQKHHRLKPFKEEFIEFLKKYEIPYNPQYLFDVEDGTAIGD
ncbi:MAG: IS200/IS605 family transposase [Bacteroidota bacterium]|nr:IS200/IS605 family transposase [Bacteroidota bacterium]